MPRLGLDTKPTIIHAVAVLCITFTEQLEGIKRESLKDCETEFDGFYLVQNVAPATT